MEQGKTEINGPHQGAWVDTPTGEDWFIHFQDKEAYGRIVHLQPMKWVNDWPVIGADPDRNGTGEPVIIYKKPMTGKTFPKQVPATSDEFNGPTLGLQWQWQANPQATWSFLTSQGTLRLYSQKTPDSARNYWDVPNLLLQKFPAEEFMMTTRMVFKPNAKLENERAGIIVMGQSYASLLLRSGKTGPVLVSSVCMDAAKGKSENETAIVAVPDGVVHLRVIVERGGLCTFGYSIDGKKYTMIPGKFKAEPGRWIGAKTGLFCTRATQINDSGYADFDWFRVEPIKK
jgi:beta-xylosidase